jgi:hypothetical protein
VKDSYSQQELDGVLAATRPRVGWDFSRMQALRDAITRAAQGGTVLDPEAVRRLLSASRRAIRSLPSPQGNGEFSR